MLTLHAAAKLLARADTFGALPPIAQALGFTPPAALDSALRRELGLEPLVARAALASGPGALRLLLVEFAGDDAADMTADTARTTTSETTGITANDGRERTQRVAAALGRAAPDRQWCLVTLDRPHRWREGTAARGATLSLATVVTGRHGPQLAALRVECHRVLDSDAETLRALATVREPDGLLRHARFTDILRREALGLRFYRALEGAVRTLADSLHRAGTARRAPGNEPSRGEPSRGEPSRGEPSHDERRELALLCVSRCLFLGFLEAKGWLDGRRDFLLHHTVTALEQDGHLHRRLLRPLFFGTLNTPRRHRAAVARAFGSVPFLNGGLFSPTPLERRHHRWHFSDDALTHLVVAVIDRYRFTAHEDSVQWSEAAVDPEMLGRAFEGLMGAAERKRSGSYYTPPTLVAHTVQAALATAMPGLPAGLLPATTDGAASPSGFDEPTRLHLRARLESLRILDPACGSGAFLVHTLETLDHLLARLGDPRDAHTRRRDLLARSIFGVDRQPMAVWLCELRLWLSVVIECRATPGERIPPLPNLDHHIRVGDSLAGGSFRFAAPSARGLARIRERYARASGTRKQHLAGTLDREERGRAMGELARRRDAVQHERRLLLGALRGRDLFGERRQPAHGDRARLRALRQRTRELSTEARRLRLGAALPFRFAAMFADVAADGGFSLVLGNPPWVRPHALPAMEREWLRREFRVMRAAGWREGAARAGAGAGFAAQADLAAAFVERSLQLLAPNGVLGLLVPAKLWRTLSGGGVRRLLLEESELRVLHDWADAPALFDAAAYPSLLVAQRAQAVTNEPAVAPTSRRARPHGPPPVSCGVTRRRTVHFERDATTLPLQGDPAAPWVLLPPAAHVAFDALRSAGVPLASSPLGRPLLGVKCGCNTAFLVHAHEHDDDHATVSTVAGTARQAVVERLLLRPALRGEDIAVLGVSPANGVPSTRTASPHDLRVLWTHGADGLPLRTLPPASMRWLAQWRPRLQGRRDARRAHPWWALFRTEAARSDLPRLVWADIARTMRCTVLPAGDPTVPLNSCYVMRLPSLDDAHALHALLTSSVINAWLGVLAEPARGGFRRFLGWTVSALPVPRDWPRAVRLLRPFGEALSATAARPVQSPVHRGMAHTGVSDAALDAAVLQAFQLPASTLTPLLEWHRHD